MSDTLAALYLRVSTLDQHPETQLHDLRQMAAQRGLEIAGVYEDRITGARASRPGLDRLMSDARQGKSMTAVLLEFIRDYVQKHQSRERRSKGRSS